MAAYTQHKLPVRQIASLFHVGVQSIYRWAKWAKDGRPTPSRPLGRPPKLSVLEQRALVDTLQAGVLDYERVVDALWEARQGAVQLSIRSMKGPGVQATA